MVPGGGGSLLIMKGGGVGSRQGRDIHLKVLEAKGIGAKGIPIQRYSKAKGIWNNIFTSPKEP